MDPNETLRELREVKARLECSDLVDIADVERMCELVGALDGWLSKDGFLPDDWKRERRGTEQYKVWTEVTAYKAPWRA